MLMAVELFHRAPPGSHWGDQQPLVRLRIVSLKHFDIVKNCVSATFWFCETIVSLKHCNFVTNCISETFCEKSLWYHEKLNPWNILWNCSITKSDISIKRIVIKHLNRIQAGRSIVATHCIKHPINLGHLHSVSLIFVQTQKSNWNESAHVPHGCFKYLLTYLMGASPAVHRSHRLPSISLWAESLPGRWNILI